MHSSSTIVRVVLFTLAFIASSEWGAAVNAQQPSGFSLDRFAEARLSNVGPAEHPHVNVANARTETLPQSLQNYQPRTQPQPILAVDPADTVPVQQPVQSFNDLLTDQAEQMITREGTGSSVKIAILLAALSLAPALILMTTCYVRVVVVLTLLRQAFGAQQLPSTQILTALALFVTFW